MAFPTTSVLDDFTRANSGTLGANWTVYGGVSNRWAVVSNQASNSGGNYTGDYWNTTYGADQECYCTLTDPPTGTDYFGIYICDQDGDASSHDCYVLGWFSGNFSIQRKDGGSETQIGSSSSHTFGASNKAGIEKIGSDVKAYLDTGSGWTQIISGTDSTYSGGVIAADSFASANDVDFDDFGGGEVVGAGGGTTNTVLQPTTSARW